MASKTPAPYRKLPGRGAGIVSVATVWEGDTHLLLVTAWPSGESYRRFFYADIQAIITRRTAGRLVINLIAAVFLIPFALAMLGDAEVGLKVFFGIVAGICFIAILVNSLLGPTCTLQIQTAIQTEKLPNVRRKRAADKLLARLLPLVNAAQAPVGTPSPAVNP